MRLLAEIGHIREKTLRGCIQEEEEGGKKKRKQTDLQSSRGEAELKIQILSHLFNTYF